MKINPSPEETPGLRRRFVVSTIIVTSIFCILGLRLWYLQILGNDYYQRLSERNRIRYVAIQAPRGSIFDRNGVLLVDNRPAFNISVLRQEIDDREKLFFNLGTLLNIDQTTLEDRWQKGLSLPRYRPLPLIEDVGRDAMEIVQENSLSLPGVLTEVKPIRAYPFGDLGAHVFGYLGQITEEELKHFEFSEHHSGDMVGKTALERKYENVLQGSKGQKRIEVNVRGRELRQVTTRSPQPGKKIYLTLDLALQKAAEKALSDNSGAVVVLDVNNGDVLALVSRPNYDPALFARGIKSDEWKSLIENPKHPMTNKALRGQYPPGSTFKMTVALAALEKGTATPNTKIQCNGSMKLGNNYEFRCWKKEGHGLVDLHTAIKESCDVWFYHVGLETGIDNIAETAFQLGLGEKTGFPFGSELSGLIPTKAWKKGRFGTGWYNGETVIASIGQGFVLATPVQLATMTAAIANGGTVWEPRVIKKIEDLEGNQELSSLPEKRIEVNWPQKNLGPIKKAMESVVNDLGGTAWRSRLDEIRVAGKTGTAQVVRKKEDEEDVEEDEIPYQFRDHALFVSYAPAEDPKIAVAVVVEHGGHGSSSAAPIARAIYEAYFSEVLAQEGPPQNHISRN